MNNYIDNIVQRAVGSELSSMVMPYVTPFFVPKPEIPYNETIVGQEEQEENEKDTADFNTIPDKQINATDPIILTENTPSHPNQTIREIDIIRNEKEISSDKPLPKKIIEGTNKLSIKKPSAKNEETGEQPDIEFRDPIKNKAADKTIKKHTERKIIKTPKKKEYILDQESKKISPDPLPVSEENPTEKKNEVVILKEPGPIKNKVERKSIIQPYIIKSQKSEKISENGNNTLENTLTNVSGETDTSTEKKNNTEKGKVTLHHNQKELKILRESRIYSISQQKKSIEPEVESPKPTQKTKHRSKKKEQSPIHITIGTIDVIAKNSNPPAESNDLPKVKPEGFDNYIGIRKYRIRS